MTDCSDKLKHNNITWNEKDNETLKTIIDLINNNQALYISDMKLAFELFTDASDKGILGILCQNGKLCRLFSHKLKETETRYSVIQKEELALLVFLKYFKEIIVKTLLILKVTIKT